MEFLFKDVVPVDVRLVDVLEVLLLQDIGVPGLEHSLDHLAEVLVVEQLHGLPDKVHVMVEKVKQGLAIPGVPILLLSTITTPTASWFSLSCTTAAVSLSTSNTDWNILQRFSLLFSFTDCLVIFTSATS